jgi:hypothetical protein
VNTKKLHELKDLMGTIAGIFDAFIGEEHSGARSKETIRA